MDTGIRPNRDTATTEKKDGKKIAKTREIEDRARMNKQHVQEAALVNKAFSSPPRSKPCFALESKEKKKTVYKRNNLLLLAPSTAFT
jgi:hypothetical protein